MTAQEGHQNLLRRCPNWYSVLKGQRQGYTRVVRGEEKRISLELF